MDYIITNSSQKELERMEEYARGVIEERQKSKESPECPIDKHTYQIVHKASNKIIRVCTVCEHESRTYYTNDELRWVEKNLHKIAQPGTALWRKLYGNKTVEEVRQLNFNQ